MTVVKIDRKKRVQRFKRLIILAIILAILLPGIACVILGIKLSKANEELKQLREIIAAGQDDIAVQSTFSTAQVEERQKKTDIATEDGVSGEEILHRVYLTFDDGPSENTDKILDILAEYNVKATFFVVGKERERFIKNYLRIVNEGHTLGMHSYSHKYEEIYASADNYQADLNKLQEFLYETTGIWSRYCRFPGGSSNTVSEIDMHELIAYLNEQDIMYYDWNVESGDTNSGKLNSDQIVTNCLEKIKTMDNAVVLMHDAADKDSTVEALPKLIEEIEKMEHTQILPITDDTVPVHHLSQDS